MVVIIGLCALTIVAWLPLIGVVLSSVVASALGCTLDEGSVHPCPVVGGIDLGPLLYEGFVLGWLMLVTWPVMLLTLLGWPVLLIVMIVRRHRAARANP